MKFSVLLSAAVCLIMASCGSKTATDSTTDNAADTAAVTPDQSQPSTASATAVAALTPADQPTATAGHPVVIDFSATWCGPCQQFKPTFHKVAEEYAGKASFYTCDIDECSELAAKYNVSSIPCVVILSEGKEPVSHVGLLSESEFKGLLDSSL